MNLLPLVTHMIIFTLVLTALGIKQQALFLFFSKLSGVSVNSAFPVAVHALLVPLRSLQLL